MFRSVCACVCKCVCVWHLISTKSLIWEQLLVRSLRECSSWFFSGLRLQITRTWLLMKALVLSGVESMHLENLMFSSNSCLQLWFPYFKDTIQEITVWVAKKKKVRIRAWWATVQMHSNIRQTNIIQKGRGRRVKVTITWDNQRCCWLESWGLLVLQKKRRIMISSENQIQAGGLKKKKMKQSTDSNRTTLFCVVFLLLKSPLLYKLYTEVSMWWLRGRRTRPLD